MDADVIVVGGGPGGAMAARALAQARMDVLVLEGTHFPRHKPCGGCLSPKISSLGVDFGEVVEDVIQEAVFTAPGERAVRYRSDTALAWMVRRERFDQLLLCEAERMGARVLYGCRVFGVHEVPGGVEVVAGRHTFRSPLLIGADGAQGIVGRSFRRRPSRIALAMDARICSANRLQDRWRGKVLIDFGSIPFGYAWVFPTAHDLSTGVLGAKKRLRGLPAHLARFLDRQSLRGYPQRVTGWPIPYPQWSLNPIGSSRVLLVGDAAGLVDPFMGEGIYYAMQSGLIAARAIAEGGTQVAGRYRRLIRHAFQWEFRSASVLAAVVHRAPTWSFRSLMRHPGAIEAFAAVLMGQSSYGAFLHRVVTGCFAFGWRRRALAA